MDYTTTYWLGTTSSTIDDVSIKLTDNVAKLHMHDPNDEPLSGI